MEIHSQTTGRLRERFREETANAILAAAEKVIAESGLHAARMEQIAGVAGVSVGTLYNHFKDRSAMIDALRASRVASLNERIREMLDAVRGRPIREQVRAYLATVAAHARHHGQFLAALMQEQLGPLSLRPPPHARAVLLPAAIEILARGVAAGELREDPTDLRPAALVALARLLLVRTVEGTAAEAEADAFTDLFLGGAAR